MVTDRVGYFSIVAAFFVVLFPSAAFNVVYGKFHIVAILVAGFVVLTWSWLSGVSKVTMSLSFLVLFLGLLSSMVAQSISQFGVSVIVVLSMNIAALLVGSGAVGRKSISMMNKWMLVILLGAWLSVLYVMLGGQPIFAFQNLDGRPNLFFLSSLSNSADYEFWGVIRPGGIYDEPGALSFAVVIVVILNELSRPRSQVALSMMLLGLVTLSVSHFALTLIYLCYYISKFGFGARLFFLTASLLSLIFLVGESGGDSVLARNLFNRFAVEDGRMVGDNRSSQVYDFIEIVKADIDISVRGHRSIFKDSQMVRYDSDQSSNPFSTWFNYGLMIWLVYLIPFLCVFFITILNISRGPVFVSGLFLILLLLQRPYVHDPMWGPAVWVAIYVIVASARHGVRFVD